MQALLTLRFRELLAAASQLDFEVVATKVLGFNAPQQDRARLKTCRILAATALLLDEKPFLDISINDIANFAGCSAATIYSRFQEKNTLIPVTYLLVRRHYTSTLDAENPFPGNSLEEICRDIAIFTQGWFENNKNLEIMAISAFSEEIGNIVSAMNYRFCRQINPIIARILDAKPEETLSSVQLAIDVNMTAYRDANLLTPASGVTTYPDSRQIARLMSLIIKASQTDDRVIL